MLQVIFYTKENCGLCEDVYTLLTVLQQQYPFEIVERDIYSNDNWLEEYQLLIPAIQLEETFLHYQQIDYDVVEKLLARHSLDFS